MRPNLLRIRTATDAATAVNPIKTITIIKTGTRMAATQGKAVQRTWSCIRQMFLSPSLRNGQADWVIRQSSFYGIQRAGKSALLGAKPISRPHGQEMEMKKLGEKGKKRERQRLN